MKFIKKFESKNQFKYVLVDPIGIRSEPTVPKIKKIFHNFINNNVGEITSDYTKLSNEDIVRVRYLNVPKKLKQFFLFNNGYEISIRVKKIITHSENKEDIEALIDANKYNL